MSPIENFLYLVIITVVTMNVFISLYSRRSVLVLHVITHSAKVKLFKIHNTNLIYILHTFYDVRYIANPTYEWVFKSTYNIMYNLHYK